MSNKEKCEALLKEYFNLAAVKFNDTFVRRDFGERERGEKMLEECKRRRVEIESEILSMIK